MFWAERGTETNGNGETRSTLAGRRGDRSLRSLRVTAGSMAGEATTEEVSYALGGFVSARSTFWR